MSLEDQIAQERLAFIRQFNKRCIAFPPINIVIGGSVNAGLLLSQLMYWAEKMCFEEFYKTNDELCEETYLSPKEFKGAKSKLLESGVVQISLKGVPAKTHYKIDLEAYTKALVEHDKANDTNGSTSWAKRDQLDGPKGTNWMGQKGPTNIEQKTTQKITHKKNTKKSLEKDFDRFWMSYPNKKAKANAKVAFEKAIKKTDLETILGAVKTYIENTDPEFYSHPATWLNQERWEDDYKPKSSSEPIELKEINRTGVDKEVCDLIKKIVEPGWYKSFIENACFVRDKDGYVWLQSNLKISYDRVDERLGDLLSKNGYPLIGWLKKE